MKKSIEVIYDWTNNQELEEALDVFYGDRYKLIFDEGANITPSIVCKDGDDLVGAMFFVEPVYKINIYSTHIVFEPKVNYVDLIKNK